ncbi:GNAT family N-acetyltransferase [Pinibacter soli]|uniref:GNAT family N-acetyltransferase n=1 Tax=Pinibacter soli TaxID=3044211 RepID=A0ABT6RHY9_9BACT|nr:GNAT family N-acetyltransferase [Pinibacter soli]MDI3322197.1 GNAT family N-acetyltransferase [Pinibacter soli]
MENVTILEYSPEYAGDFKRLNIEWIEKYFVVEEHDIEQLNNPEEYIISKGGYILFAQYNNEIVGVCALIRTNDESFELAKMAVSSSVQGKQIGTTLGIATLNKAKAMGANHVWLESNRILEPAIHLYKKLGFVEIPIAETPYARADIKMEVWL